MRAPADAPIQVSTGEVHARRFRGTRRTLYSLHHVHAIAHVRSRQGETTSSLARAQLPRLLARVSCLLVLLAAGMSDETSARHAKTVSVGNAASLFGAEGASDDFFGTLSSAKPTFDAVAEEEEDAGAGADTLFGSTGPEQAAPDAFGSSSNDWYSTATNSYAQDHAEATVDPPQPSYSYDQASRPVQRSG